MEVTFLGKFASICVAAGLAVSFAGIACQPTPSRTAQASERPAESHVASVTDDEESTPTPAQISVSKSQLNVADGYPVWLEVGEVRTDQTSGIAFVERDANGTLRFLTCDDLGKIHRLELDEAKKPSGQTYGDGWMTLAEIAIPDSVKETLGVGPAKLDLEEISYRDGGVLLSVEGNRSDEEAAIDPRMHEARIGLFFLELDAPVASASSVAAAFELPLLSTQWPDDPAAAMHAIPVAGMPTNRSFEGVALGATAITDDLGQPADASVIWIAPEEPYPNDAVVPESWRETLPIYRAVIGQIPIVEPQSLPAELKLGSVCGLALSPDQSDLYVLDRNNRVIHRCRLNADGNITAVESATLTLLGPSGEQYFLPSLESLTIDDQGHLWSVIDPWQYRPIQPEDRALELAEVRRYEDLVPMLYKFGKWGE